MTDTDDTAKNDSTTALITNMRAELTGQQAALDQLQQAEKSQFTVNLFVAAYLLGLILLIARDRIAILKLQETVKELTEAATSLPAAVQ